jgi:hypothetical protein
LRNLGRGLTFDDIEESTCISAETHRTFFHRFVEFGSAILFPKLVNAPNTSEFAQQCESEFLQAGFDSCIGSSHATHVPMNRCSFSKANANKSFKVSRPCSAFNMMVNHRSSTWGLPARWNDKKNVLFDDFVLGIHEGDLYSDHVFELLEADARGEITRVKYRGVWLLVDNGYLAWPTTVPPIKDAVTREEYRW